MSDVANAIEPKVFGKVFFNKARRLASFSTQKTYLSILRDVPLHV